MVPRLAPVKSAAKPLSYNEEKVSQGRAELVHAGNFLQEINSLTYADKLERFQRLNELNTRSQTKMLHATLNFSPMEKLSNAQLSAIADRYMQGLHMEDQPYLVYRHGDANHPHIHIVSSLIRPDGSRIKTHLMASRLSEPTRKAIEQEFELAPSHRRKSTSIIPANELQKLNPGSIVPVSESIDNILASVNRHYHFTNLPEYNAILRAYNVTASTGSPGSKTRQHAGIYYIALDDQGQKVSPPIMASQLPSRPTLTRLQEKFHHPDANHLDHLTSIRQRIDWALNANPATLKQLVSKLQSDGIEIVVPPGNGRNPHDQIYVDYRTRTAVAGETLGSAYTTEAITNATRQERHVTKHKRQGADLPEATQFNANVPQLLSAMLRTEPGAFGTDDFGLDQSLGPRHKL